MLHNINWDPWDAWLIGPDPFWHHHPSHKQIYVHSNFGCHATAYKHTHTHAHACTHTHTLRGGGKNQAIAAFHKTVLSLSHVIMFRDKIDGSLRGVFMINVNHFEKYTTIRVGWSFFKNYYKGSPFLYLASGYFFLRGILMPLCKKKSSR